MKSLWRAALVAALLLSIPAYVLQYTLVPGAGNFGLTAVQVNAPADVPGNSPGAVWRVTNVVRESPAWRAGMRAGDLVALAGMDRASRVALAVPLPGDRISLTYERGSLMYHAVLVAVASPAYVFTAADGVRAAITLLLLLFALLVVLRAWKSENGPLIATIVMFDVLNPATDNIPFTAHSWAGAAGWWLSFVVAELTFPLALLLVLVLAARLMTARNVAARWLTWAFGVFGIGLSLLQIAWQIAAVFGEAWTTSALVYTVVIPIFFSVALLITYAAARGEGRQRLRWLCWGFVPFSLGVAAFNLFAVLPATAAWAQGGSAWAVGVQTFFRLLELSLPVSLFYGVLVRRTLDLGFVFNRVAVYGALSAMLVGLFVLLEYGATRLFEQTGHAGSLAIQLAIALIIGLSARYLHGYVDRFVDRVLFAKRHADESALRRFAREAEAYTSADTLLDRACEVVCAHSEARAAAIYREKDGCMRPVRSSAPEFPQSVDLDDPLLVDLRRWNEPADTHDAKSVFPDGMLFPMTVRGRLLGVLACERKIDGTAYAPDERESLTEVAHSVGTSLDALGSADSGSRDELLKAIRALHTVIVERFQRPAL